MAPRSMPSLSPLGFRFEVSDESHRHPHGPDDAIRKAGPAYDDCLRLYGHRAGDRGGLHAVDHRRHDRQSAEHGRCRARARDAATGRREVTAWHSAADRPGHHPRPSHALSDPARGGGHLRRNPLGAHGARGRARRRGRRPGDDFRADARRVARSPLGPHRGRPGRRPLAQRAHRAGQGARFPGDRSVVGRIAGRLCEAFRRVRRGHRGAGVRRRGHLRAHLARSASAGLRGGGPRRRRDADAVLHRSQRRADDGAHPLAARLAARRDGLRRRHRQRLQRDRGVDQARGRRRSRRCRGAGAEGRRRHRHDGRRVSQGSADRARAGPGDDRGDRRVRAPRVAAQGAARSVRRPLPPRRDTGARGGRRRAARAGARRRRAGPSSC